MLTIRAATPPDAGAIARVHVQSWQTTYVGIVPEAYLAALDATESTAMWRAWLTQDVLVYIADWNGEVVGFVSGGAIREALQGYDAELFAIYLLKQAQGRGIGTALLRAMAESLRAAGLRSMAVWVLESNSSGRFYEKSGALLISSKQIEIGGATLPALAYGWPDLQVVAPSKEPGAS